MLKVTWLIQNLPFGRTPQHLTHIVNVHRPIVKCSTYLQCNTIYLLSFLPSMTANNSLVVGDEVWDSDTRFVLNNFTQNTK